MGNGPKILAVDDNGDALFALEQLLLTHGYDVSTAQSGEETLAKAAAVTPDLILLDVVMPDLTGYQVVKALKQDPRLRFIPVVMLSSRSDLSDITQGLDAGADDYVSKPFRSDELLARVTAALRTKRIYQELSETVDQNKRLNALLSERASFSNIIGGSPQMKKVFSLIEKVADSHVPILIWGESGTGKELVAQSLHYNSRRRNAPLIVQNCSAFTETLLESELFGHAKGSFTGASKDKAGLFQMADTGTFFLDEIGEMSLALQAKLLRVLQDGTFTPVGETKQRKVDVRVIGATHRDLPDMIKKGTFREDLYYRLNVVTLELPPLRERTGDIPLLVDFFLEKKAIRAGKPKKALETKALKVLLDHVWPGNIRQLENEIERAVLLAGDENILTSELFSSSITSGNQPKASSALSDENLKDAVSRLEKEMIQETLKKVSGNKSEAARILGISRSSLIAKVGEYKLEDVAE